jgi:hypothetical protein
LPNKGYTFPNQIKELEKIGIIWGEDLNFVFQVDGGDVQVNLFGFRFFAEHVFYRRTYLLILTMNTTNPAARPAYTLF